VPAGDGAKESPVQLYVAPFPKRRAATLRQIDAFLNRKGGRIAFCGHWVQGTHVELQVKAGRRGRRASYKGCAKCDSWDCPRCAKCKASRQAVRLQAALSAAVHEEGCMSYFATLTPPHSRSDRLQDLMKVVRKALKAVLRKLKTRPDFAGYAYAWEVTLGKSGWHPHVHLIVLLHGDAGFNPDVIDGHRVKYEGLNPNQSRLMGPGDLTAAGVPGPAPPVVREIGVAKENLLDALEMRRDDRNRVPSVRRCEDELRVATARAIRLGRWRGDLWQFEYDITSTWCRITGADWRPGCQDIRKARTGNAESNATTSRLVAYLVKVSFELSGAPGKRGQKGNLTPRGILEAAAAGSGAAARAWDEYRAALKGMERLGGIDVLERTFGTKDAGRPEEQETLETIIIGLVKWKIIRGNSLDGMLLKTAVIDVDAARLAVSRWEPEDMAGICIGAVVAAFVRRWGEERSDERFPGDRGDEGVPPRQTASAVG
jgi:hypothetical protein